MTNSVLCELATETYVDEKRLVVVDRALRVMSSTVAMSKQVASQMW